MPRQEIKGDTVILVFGALGDLAKKAIFPNLFSLYSKGLLPTQTKIFGLDTVPSSPTSLSKFQTQTFGLLGPAADDHAADQRRLFGEDVCSYVPGDWGATDGGAYLALERKIEEAFLGKAQTVHRISYLAIPPQHFANTSLLLRRHNYSSSSPFAINRLCVEKPLGRDSESCEVLLGQLSKSWDLEREVFLVDHLLGEGMYVEGILQARFGNGWVTDEMLSRKCVRSIVLECCEPYGAEGRGGYFDHYGLIRDLCQNHILQALTFMTIEAPKSLQGDDLRDAKVALLKCIPPLLPEQTILGQYTASKTDPTKKAYTDDETVKNKDSKAETFAEMVFWIDNERWRGVPVVMRCGKAINKGGLRYTYNFHPPPAARHSLFPSAAPTSLTISNSSDGPTISLGTNFNTPVPSLTIPTSSSTPVTPHPSRPTSPIAPFPDQPTSSPTPSAPPTTQGLARSPEGGTMSYTHPTGGFGPSGVFEVYETVLLAVLKGERSMFVREDELREAWRVFTPLLHWKDGEGEGEGGAEVRVRGYEYGGEGPEGTGRWD